MKLNDGNLHNGNSSNKKCIQSSERSIHGSFFFKWRQLSKIAHYRKNNNQKLIVLTTKGFGTNSTIDFPFTFSIIFFKKCIKIDFRLFVTTCFRKKWVYSFIYVFCMMDSIIFCIKKRKMEKFNEKKTWIFFIIVPKVYMLEHFKWR